MTDVSEPKLQYSRIDVYFRARVDGRLVSFVVEDKVGTEMHGDQLYRYRQVVEEDHLEEDEILLVYFKTGFVYPDERALAKKAGFTVFDLDDLQQFLCRDPMEKDHEILRQYRDRVQRIAAERERALQDWDWSQGFLQFDFMSRLRKVLAERRREWSTLTGDRNSSDLP